MVKNKKEVLGHLKTLHVNFVLGTAMPKMITPSQWQELADDKEGFIIGETIPIERVFHYESKTLCEDLANGKTKNLEYFQIGVRKNLISNSYELVKYYCNISSQKKKFTACTFYHFARIMRNVISHNTVGILLHWDSELTDLGIDEVKWFDRTISKSIVGQPIHFSDYEALKLFHQFEEFVKNELD